MDLYGQLAALGCFTRKDVVHLAGSERAAATRIKDYLHSGCIQRVRRDLYAAVDAGGAIPNRFQIASRITDDACVSHHGAFEYYGCANQVFHYVYFATKQRIRPFWYEGLRYYPLASRGNVGVIETDDGVRVTSPERTVIDGIADFGWAGGLEELLHCILDAPPLDADKLLEALEMYDRGLLYQRSGYILETLREDLNLPEAFFEACERRCSAHRAYLFQREDNFVLHRRWNLYAPANLINVLIEGIDPDAIG